MQYWVMGMLRWHLQRLGKVEVYKLPGVEGTEGCPWAG